MCESCVQSASKPLRVSTNGCEQGRISLLIDSDEHGTVISVEVGIDELVDAMRTARNRQRLDLIYRNERMLGQKMSVGRQVPLFTPTHQIKRGSDDMPREVYGFPVEILERPSQNVVVVMLPNGYTRTLNEYDIEPLNENPGT